MLFQRLKVTSLHPNHNYGVLRKEGNTHTQTHTQRNLSFFQSLTREINFLRMNFCVNMIVLPEAFLLCPRISHSQPRFHSSHCPCSMTVDFCNGSDFVNSVSMVLAALATPTLLLSSLLKILSLTLAKYEVLSLCLTVSSL